MALKQWLGHLQPVQLYVMLVLTAGLFLGQMSLSYKTHSLTLLVDSYHMLCNLIALIGCIITIKKGVGNGRSPADAPGGGSTGSSSGAAGSSTEDNIATNMDNEISTLKRLPRSAADRRLTNTFGWARIDVLVSLFGSVCLASLLFSLLVEAIQTLLHIDHHDEMHDALWVVGAGVASLVVNILCYLLIGGYTFHQGSFFHVTASGDVVLERGVTQDSVKLGCRRLSSQRRPASRQTPPLRQRQGCRETLRDTICCIIVIVTSLAVFFTDQSVAKLADPIMSIVSATILLILSYPYMKEAGLILLQTIPDHMDINQLRKDIYDAFPDIVNVHDLHVWRLTQTKVFCTAHVVFQNPKDYVQIRNDVTAFFDEQGVTQVTVQPEFINQKKSQKAIQCLMNCPGLSCLSAHCCSDGKEVEDSDYVRVASDISLPRSQDGNGILRCRQRSANSDQEPKSTQDVVVEMYVTPQTPKVLSKVDASEDAPKDITTTNACQDQPAGTADPSSKDDARVEVTSDMSAVAVRRIPASDNESDHRISLPLENTIEEEKETTS